MRTDISIQHQHTLLPEYSKLPTENLTMRFGVKISAKQTGFIPSTILNEAGLCQYGGYRRALRMRLWQYYCSLHRQLFLSGTVFYPLFKIIYHNIKLNKCFQESIISYSFKWSGKVSYVDFSFLF